MYCLVCALPAKGVCRRCVKEGAPLRPICTFCKEETFFEDRVEMACGDIAHIKCAEVVNVIGCCPGECWERQAYEPDQIPTFVHENKEFVFKTFMYATKSSPETKTKFTRFEIQEMEESMMFSTLSSMFLDGVGVPKNEKISDLYLKKASDPESMRKVYVCELEEVMRAKVEMKLSRDLIEELEDDKMYFTLSCVYLNGVGVPKNEKRSKLYFKKALDAKDPNAMYVKADKKGDFLLMQKAANLGHAKAIRAVANYYMGKSQTDMALKYIKTGKDPMCRAMLALTAYDAGSPDAERMLRRARHFYTTESMYFKATCNLASIYTKRGDHRQAIALLTMLHKQTDASFLLLGIAYSAVGDFDKAEESLLSSEDPDASVFIAKLMRAKAIKGDEVMITRWMSKAVQGGHAEAAFYFLSKGDLPAPEVKKLVRILGQCRNKALLLQFAKEFKDGKQLNFCKLCHDLVKALG